MANTVARVGTTESSNSEGIATSARNAQACKGPTPTMPPKALLTKTEGRSEN